MFTFDRLVRLMDGWAAQTGRTDVFAQIGKGGYEPKHMAFERGLSQAAFNETSSKADLIIAHAGVGSVIAAGLAGRPIVLLPRTREQGEINTDHQLATANWLRDRPGIFVADTDKDLSGVIEKALSTDTSRSKRLGPVADKAFTDRLRSAILAPKK